MPFFDYKGEMMCNLAAFKQHCAMGFWKAALMKDKVLLENASSESSMGHLGRITSLKDLPSDKKILSWIKEAMMLNDKGIKVQKEKTVASVIPEIHPEFKKALKSNPISADNFKSFTPGAKKEYIQWVSEAKSEATRHKRILQSIEWISEGKKRNWKYEK